MNFEDILDSLGCFGKYQILLWVLNAYGILAVVGNMVFSTFGNIKPNSVSCLDSNESYNWSESNQTCWMIENCQDLEMTYDFKSTIIDMRLICNKGIYTMFNTVLMIGVFIGSIMFGQVSDFFGRKWTTQISFSLMLVTGFSSAFCTNWKVYLFSRLMNGVFVGGYMVTSYVLLNEITGAKYRLFVRSIGHWTFGVCCFALTAYLAKDWKILAIIVNCQCVFGIAGYCFVYESPRYLLQYEKLEEAHEVLQNIAKMNGKTLELDVIEGLKTIATKQPRKRYSVKDLFSTRQLSLYTIANLYLSFSLSVTAYSLLFSQVSLGGNKFLNVFISGFSGQILLIGVTILDRFFPKYFGRKPITIACLTFILIAVFIVTITITVPEAYQIKSSVETYLSVLSNGVASLAWAAVWLFSIELYPTVVRNVAAASSGASSRLGGMLAPIFASYLNTIWPALQYVVIGILVILAIVSTAIIIPETSRKDMPELSEHKNSRLRNSRVV